MSGYTGDVMINYGIDRENTDFIQKIFSLQELAEKVREILKRKSHEKNDPIITSA